MLKVQGPTILITLKYKRDKFNHYLQRCARDLKGWSTCRFWYMPKRVKQLQEHIDTLQNAPPNGANNRKLWTLKVELDRC